MSPNILAIVGSPRRGGNTHVLLTAVQESASRAGVDTHELFLNDLTIGECTGCHVCWQGEECVCHDDMNPAYRLIAAADVIVFGTPVYWYGPTALMKAFIDRLVFFNCPQNRRGIRGKHAAIVIPYEEQEPETVAPVVDFFKNCFHFLDVHLAEELIVPGVTRRGEVQRKPDVMQAARDLGERLAELARAE